MPIRLLRHTGVYGLWLHQAKPTSDQGDELSLFSSLRGGPATRAMDHWCENSLGGSSFSWHRGGPPRAMGHLGEKHLNLSRGPLSFRSSTPRQRRLLDRQCLPSQAPSSLDMAFAVVELAYMNGGTGRVEQIRRGRFLVVLRPLPRLSLGSPY